MNNVNDAPRKKKRSAEILKHLVMLEAVVLSLLVNEASDEGKK